MIFDPMYFVFVAPALLLAVFAQFKVKSAYAKASEIPASSRMSGAETAQAILRSTGVTGVDIESIPGKMSDHYDPRSKTLRLSEEVYHGRSIAALGIAAHEVGHAIQDAKKYMPLVARNAIVPMASFGSNMAFFFIFIGAMVNAAGMILLGVLLFSTTVVFQLVNLPVEFDASNRARQILLSSGFISTEEEKQVGKVLNAAALTYVAATISAVLTLLYYLWRLGIIGGGNRD